MEEVGEDGGGQGRMGRMGRREEIREDGGGRGGWRRSGRMEEVGEDGGGQDRGMGSREEQSVIPGQHLAHFLLQGCFCCLLPEEAGHSAHSVLGEHLRGSLEQDLTLLPLKPALSCSRAGLSLTGSPRHFQSVIPVTAARAGEAPQECPGASSARAHLSSPGSCWSRRQAVLGSPPGSSASGTPCHAAQHTPAGGGALRPLLETTGSPPRLGQSRKLGVVRGWGLAPQTSVPGQANPEAPPPPSSHTGPAEK